ncbi:hypothetical protein IPV08_15915 [Methylobacterium sp. SD274]|uniref:hypothetical protein n=1 Tax=Methylobacterium sp. SD274 TaxID=2782009 RepID=UPI001A95FFF1|nr:hypothetical protein [Methylobacterium sp. SD274]MBO1021448.1 hypothetical protein [Methylobacterium sp. SD274]
MDETEHFRWWFACEGYPHCVEAKLNQPMAQAFERAEQIREWLRNVDDWIDRHDGLMGVRFVGFKSPNDAFAFKLRWG